MTEHTKMEAMVRKVQALLNTKGCSEAEAQARVAKAQELVEAYGLDMAVVGGNDNARKDQKRKGGLYSWQRNLWKAVAELNFCYYFSIKGLQRGSQYEHRLIGSHANVITTELMAQYLQDTVERLAQQWAKENFYKSVFVREAIAYREGITGRLSERLRERREAIVTAERQKAEERKRDEAYNGVSTGNALTILDVISSEADFNNDYLQGWEMGTTARNRAKREAENAEYMRRYHERMRQQAEWDAAHPEEAAERRRREAEEMAKWAEKERKRANRRKEPASPRYRKPTPEEERMQMGSYWEGHRKGATVGIDTQVDKNKQERIGWEKDA